MRAESRNEKEKGNWEMSLEKYLYDKVLPVIQGWDEDGIYAISFYVNSNEANEYEGITNFPEFAISYNTEKNCENASELSEERWNYAYWRQDETFIIDSEGNDGAAFLLSWYEEQGIKNIGYEDDSNAYNEDMEYIGKGPIGYYELLCTVAEVGRMLQSDGIISEKFGNIPIIVHGLDYCWYVKEATERANPNGEAEIFLKSLEEWAEF